jgi:bifunctional non-homologous end joining protein LigD
MAELDEYRRKRDERRTPEPFAGGEASGDRPMFVVQRHDARRLHYDFRLERDGVLASWAVPKGIPLMPGEKVLAVHVEDHPVPYAEFEGEIPAGSYGAGSVEIWDRGRYETVEEKPDGGLTVRLHGARLRGVWTLVPARLSGEEKNWLLLKKREPAGSPDELPFQPMLATAAEDVPRDGDWRFEVKWDGYRAIARVDAAGARLWSRNGNDLTGRFPDVAAALPDAIGGAHAILDGEVCALDDDGRPSFSAMQQGKPVVLYLFDVLALGERTLLDEPLERRQAELAALVASDGVRVRVSRPFEDGAGLLAVAQEQGLEGVIAKRAGSRYAPGRRSRDWLKLKAKRRDEFVIAGFTRGRGRREGTLGALVLATNRGGDLVWAGNCGTGFDDREIDRLLRRLRPLERGTPPLAHVPKMPRMRRGDVVWVSPRLVCEVEFAEWTHGGQLRAPSYKGLRDDKAADEVRRERPPTRELRRRGRALALSNLTKPFWPDGTTKGDLVDYYLAVAPALLPHLRDRPFTLRRYPDGIDGESFFQKDAPSHMPDWIATAALPAGDAGGRTIRYPLVNDELALAWVANMGCIDMNAWYSRIDRPDRPDFALFDLDPAEGAGFREAARVAHLVRAALAALGLEGFPKTSGGDGVHVLVPVSRRHTYAETRQLVEVVAGALVRTHPRLVTLEWSKTRRRGVLIDANQNGMGKTIASAYSVRPRPGAPVSAPLRWDELSEDTDPRDFTMEVMLERVARQGDLLAPALELRQSIRPALARLGADRDAG